jgi:hypothetical protein
MLVHHLTLVPPALVRERGSRYGRDWYRDAGGPPGPEHPVTGEAERRVRRRDRGLRWARIRELAGSLHAGLDGDLLRTWLALEDHLHRYLLDIAAEHYNLGVDAGAARTRDARRLSLPKSGAAKARLKWLLEALADEIDRLP